MSKDDDIPVLHRYFMWANRMRDLFDQTHARSIEESTVEGKLNPLIWFVSDGGMYMSYWYASLYVVIEGWRELDLHDEEVESLIQSPNVDHLRRYRNGLYHFQRNYLDPRFTELMGSADSVAWVRRLTGAFARVLYTEMQRINSKSARGASD